MDDVKTDSDGLKSRSSLREFVNSLFKRIGIGRNGVLFAACCLAAASLVQAVWTIIQARILGIAVAGSWHEPVGWLFTEGRATALPILVAALTASCWRFGKKPAYAAILLSLISCHLCRPQNDYLSFGVSALIALLLVGYVVYKD